MNNTATLVQCVRGPRSGEIQRPSEEVTIIGVIRNLDRTLMKVRCQPGATAWCFRKSLKTRKSGEAVDVFPKADSYGAQQVDDQHDHHSLAGSGDECQTPGERMAKREEIEEWLATSLAIIAGFLDAYGYITYQTYTSFMSGNTTRAGDEIGQGNIGQAVNPVLAIVFFVGGSFAGALLAYSSVRRIRRLVFAVIAMWLALIIIFTQIGPLSDLVIIASISFAMGAMNTALSRIGARSKVGAQSVSLTFVTGTLSRIGMQLALAVRRAPLPDSKGAWDTHTRRALVLAGIWAGFIGGALLSGAATSRFGAWALLFPMLALLALAAFDRSSSVQPERYESEAVPE